MIEVPVYNMGGSKIGSESIDEALLGGTVRVHLLKQAVIAYEASERQGSAATKTRAEVHGAKRKLYRQKGTGNARAGNLRTPLRRGGGHTFAKSPRDFSQRFPRRMRKLARNSALLAKLKAGSAVIIDSIAFDAPKTRAFAGMLSAVGANGTCLVALAGRDMNAWRSGRNIPGVHVCPVDEMNAYHVLKPRNVIFSRDAFVRMRETAGGSAAPEESSAKSKEQE